MTLRKPAGMSFESFIDRQIREAQARGEFDNLPGAGKPIPDLDRPMDDLWWGRSLLKREGLSFLPASLELKRHLEKELERIMALGLERGVRRAVAELNAHIARVNSRTVEGPPSDVAQLDEDRVVELWRSHNAT